MFPINIPFQPPLQYVPLIVTIRIESWRFLKAAAKQKRQSCRENSLLQNVISAEAPLGNSHNGGATDLKRIGEQTLPEVTADDSAEADGVDKVMMPENLAVERARATASVLA